MAGLISFQDAAEPPQPPCIGVHLALVAPDGGCRSTAFQDGVLPIRLRRVELSAHPLDIGHGPAHLPRGHLQGEGHHGLQEHAPALHQALAQRPVSGLPEIAALGVLDVGTACQQRNLHVRDRRACQHPRMGAFLQMGQNQPLPVPVQHVLAAGAGKLQAAARLPRFQQQMHLRIMAQWLEMPDALHSVGDGLLVQDLAVRKLHVQAEPLRYQPFQDLYLHLAHDLHMDFRHIPLPGQETSPGRRAFPHRNPFFRCRIVLRLPGSPVCRPLPDHMELRLFLLQLPELPQHLHRVAPLRQHQSIGQHGHQNGDFIAALPAQPLSGEGPVQSGHGADSARLHLIHSLKLPAAVDSNLVHLLLPDLRLRPCAARIAHRHLHPQHASCDFQVGQSVA